jgi:hypothetical protein
MLGRDRRERAQATVVVADIDGLRAEDMVRYEFILDVQPAEGEPFRATAHHTFFALVLQHPKAGDVVTVSFAAKGRDKVRLEIDGDERYDLKLQEARRQDARAAALAAPVGSAPIPTPQEALRAAQEDAMAYAVLRKGLEAGGTPGTAVLHGVADAAAFPPLAAYAVQATITPDGGDPPFDAAFTVWVDPRSRPVIAGSTVPVRIDPADQAVVVLDHAR